MSDPEPIPTAKESEPRDSGGFEGHRTRQARSGLDLTPVERLRWLERTMDGMRRLVGRARQGRVIGREGS